MSQPVPDLLVAPPVVQEKRWRPQQFPRHYAEKYQYPIHKAFFFVLNEGVATTLRKYHSKAVEREIEHDQVIVTALLEVGGQRYLGFTRRLGGPLVFHTRLIFELGAGHDISEVRLSEAAVRMMESFVPVPSCPLPEGLPGLIVRENLFLRPITSAAAWERFAVQPKPAPPVPRNGGVFLVGFGGYVREYVLPYVAGRVAAAVDYKARLIQKHLTVDFPVYTALAEVRGQIAVAKEPLVVISTYHSDHARVAFEVLDANPKACVFIEKPAAVELADALRLAELRRQGAWIDVGYNRRYPAFTQVLRDACVALPRPCVVNMLVKELRLPASHWYFWPNQGTRITGNVCHWIDLAVYLMQAAPTELTLLHTGDTIAAALLFSDGSLVNITATDFGHGLRGVEEWIEVRGGDTTLTLLDFKQLVMRSGATSKSISRWRRDKGHAAMYRDLSLRWAARAAPLYPAEDIVQVTRICGRLSEMMTWGIRSDKLVDR